MGAPMEPGGAWDSHKICCTTRKSKLLRQKKPTQIPALHKTTGQPSHLAKPRRWSPSRPPLLIRSRGLKNGSPDTSNTATLHTGGLPTNTRLQSKET